MTNTEQIAAMAAYIEKLEKALREIALTTKGASHMQRVADKALWDARGINER